MDSARRARLQTRAVMIVLRQERARGLADESMRRRCLALLDQVRAALDGAAQWHAEVLAEVEAARAEVEAA